jgi:Immunoglobulin domain/Beta-propeller repeat
MLTCRQSHTQTRMNSRAVLLLLIPVALVFAEVRVRAQVQLAWAALGTPQQETANPAARLLALDGTGNVYVSSAGTMLKYAADGTKLWSTGSSNGTANLLAVDSASNAYLSGNSFGATANFTTVKYAPNGSRLWVAEYDNGGDDIPAAMTVDSAGNVYATGSSISNGTGRDYATVKYGTNGNQLWVSRYNGDANGDDSPKAVTVDGAGRVFVTGTSNGTNGTPAYATVAYGANGNQLWVARYDAGPGFSYTYPRALALDNGGNVYVTGASGFGYPYHYLTVKYDGNGNEVWTARYVGDGSNNDPTAIGVDTAGNVYVTGGLYRTVKYDSNGNQLWVARYNGPTNTATTVALSTALALDSTGNVHVTGYIADDGGGFGSHWVCATVKYDAHGNQLWVANYGVSPQSFATRLAVNDGGDVFVAGYSGSAPPPNGYYNYSTLTLKYTQTTVTGLPVITSDPQGQSVLAGTDVTLTVEASGTVPLGYQWRLDGRDIVGATDATLFFTNVRTSQNGEYSVKVSNSIGWTVSPDARLTVNSPPLIQTQPQSQTVFAGDFAILSVEADGWPYPNLQWQLNGTNLVGQNYGQLINWNVAATDAGNYTVVASNSVGSVTSAVAVLTVIVQAPIITAQPVSRSVYVGENGFFEVQAIAHPPPVYQWQYNEMDIAGATNSVLGLGNVTTNQAGSFRVIVSNYVGAVTSVVATLTVSLQAPTLLIQPASQTAITGTTVAFSVLAEAHPPPTYQWAFDGAALVGAMNASLILSNVTRSNAGGYTVVISNSVGVITSEVATLTVNFPGPLDRWSVRSLPVAVSLNAVSYAKDMFMGVGDGFFVTSSNGITWTSRSLGTSLLLHGITWGNGLFVAVGYDNSSGNSAILTSPNGLTWTSRNPATRAFLGSVAYASGIFVAVGGSYDSTVLTSTDGVTWTSRNTGTAYSLGGIEYGRGRFVVAGGARADLPASFLTSIDGISWSSSGYLAPWMGIGGLAFGTGNTLVAVGVNYSGDSSGYYGIVGNFALGSNGLAWSLVTNALYDVAYGDGTFVAVGVNGTILSSLDGYYWKPRISGTSGYLVSIAYGKGTFVVVGPSGAILQSGYAPVILSGQIAPSGDFDLTMNGGIEGNYRVQATANLGSNEWVDLTGYSVTYTNVQVNVRFSDRTTTNFSERYYRVMSP